MAAIEHAGGVLTTMNFGDPLFPAEFPTKSTAVPVRVADGRTRRQMVEGDAPLMPALDVTGFTLVKLPPPVRPPLLFDTETVKSTCASPRSPSAPYLLLVLSPAKPQPRARH